MADELQLRSLEPLAAELKTHHELLAGGLTLGNPGRLDDALAEVVDARTLCNDADRRRPSRALAHYRPASAVSRHVAHRASETD